MQNQNIDQARVLRREDELTDISKMPLSQVKPQESRAEQPSSQRSTMQSVSMGEVPSGSNEETILGSVASIHDQMQPGSFMSPISDRKSGSIENLSGEERTTSTDSNAINTFAQKTVEKIEGIIHAAQGLAHTAADKIAEFAKDLTSEPNRTEANRLMKSAQAGAQDLKNDLTKRAYLVRSSVSRRLGKRGEKLQKSAGMGAGVAKVYAKEELKSLQRKARRYGRTIDQEARFAKRSFNKNEGDFGTKARAFQRDFEQEAALAGEALRRGAFDLRQKARSLLNNLPREAKLAKDSFLSEIKSELNPSTQAPSSFESSAPNKFVLNFSASEWNGSTGKSRPQFPRRSAPQGGAIESNPSKWSIEVPAHEWNESSQLLARQQAGFLLNLAQDYLKRASKQYSFAEKRLRSSNYMRDARSYYNQALKKGSEISNMIKGQVNELVNEATRRFADSTFTRPAQDLKQRPQGFADRAAQKGSELLRNLDETKDAAQRKLIEKKADLQFQAELLSTDKFPSQEALSKKQAINDEIRSRFGKENIPQ